MPCIWQDLPQAQPSGNFLQVCKSAPGKKSSETGKAQSKKPQKQKVHQVTDYSSDDSIYIVQATRDRVQYFTLLDVHAPSQDKTMLMRLQLYSGATCSTMRLGDYMKLAGAPPPSTTGRIKVYDGRPLKPAGADTLCCSKSDITKRVHFNIIDNAPTSLLLGRAAEALRLLQFNHEQLVNAISDTDTSGFTQKQVLEEYNDVFHGLGKLPGYYHIDMDPTATPVQHTKCHVPIPVCDELKARIDQLEQQEVLAKVTEPTPWMSSMVVVRNATNKIRICLDPLDLNKGIKHNHYLMPTIEEVAPHLIKPRSSLW